MNESASMFITGCFVTYFILAVFFGVGGGGRYDGTTAEELYSELSSCESQVFDYREKISSANNDIDEVNNRINDVVNADSFDDLRDSIYNLSEIDRIPEE